MQVSQPSPRKIIGVMGEFSVGKSTLCNLILGINDLPEMVTATQLPPVWFTKGAHKDTLVLTNGETFEIGEGFELGKDFTNVSHLLLHRDCAILDMADVVDFPGISDPNMDAEVWQRLLPKMDGILWLTHATQAWRQSEAAVWNTVSDPVKAQSALVVTQMDKLVSETDKSRILKRLQFEAGQHFGEIIPVSLNQVSAEDADLEALEASGAVALMEFLLRFEGADPIERQTAPAAPEISKPTAAPADDASLLALFDESEEQALEQRMPAEADIAKPDLWSETLSRPAVSSDAMDTLKYDLSEDDAECPSLGMGSRDELSDRIVPRRVKPIGKSRRTRLQKSSDSTSPSARMEAVAAQF